MLKIQLPRDIARAAASALTAPALAALVAEVLSSEDKDSPHSEALTTFARGLEESSGLTAFVAMGAAQAAVEHVAALRFVELVTGSKSAGVAA